MAHEITETDGLVLAGSPAWHGLGTLVDHAPTPSEALAIARLNWDVEQWGLTATQEDHSCDVKTHVLNVRSDNHAPLGVVGADYQPIQNTVLAQFAATLASEGRVRVESAGSIRGGKRVWFLVQGESIWPNDSDQVHPYLLIANGHDGSLAFTCQPTTIRVVCRNTLHASLKQQHAQTIRLRHEGDIVGKLEAVREAVGLFNQARDEMAATIKHLASQEMSREQLQRYWLDVYSQAVEPIPAAPATPAEHTKANRAKQTFATWANNFDRDRQRTASGATAWAALNAATEWFDHQRVVRGHDALVRSDTRTFGKLWGAAAVAKRHALQLIQSR